MRPIRMPPQSSKQIKALEELYHTTKDVRLRTRAQMMLLAAEKHLVAREIAEIVREDEQRVRRWMKRYMAEGIEGLKDAPRPGATVKVTPAYEAELIRVVRLRPRSMGLAFSLWTPYCSPITRSSGGDLELVGQAVGQVHDLGFRPAANDADAQACCVCHASKKPFFWVWNKVKQVWCSIC